MEAKELYAALLGIRYPWRVEKVVLDIKKNRDQESLGTDYSLFSKEECRSVKAVAMDMWDPYLAATRKWLPQAEVVFDRFHVVRQVTEAAIIVVTVVVLGVKGGIGQNFGPVFVAGQRKGHQSQSIIVSKSDISQDQVKIQGRGNGLVA